MRPKEVSVVTVVARGPACRILENVSDGDVTHTQTDRQLTRVSARTRTHARNTNRDRASSELATVARRQWWALAARGSTTSGY